MEFNDLPKKAAQIRLETLLSISNAGFGASGSSMSIIEILVALYYGEIMGRRVMYFDADKPGWEGQDYFVLSKGQAAPALYTVLADLGFFDKSELNFYARSGSMLQSKPVSKIPGIAVSSISTGMGLSKAMGLAKSIKMDRSNNKVFCLMGDGELQEGQVWEAAMAASQYKLNNLVVFVDNNKVQGGGNINSIMEVSPIQGKFEAFGWNVIQVRDGHDFNQLLHSLERAFTSNRMPVVVWCHTVCGKGIEFAEGKPGYQSVPLSEGEINEIIPNLKSQYDSSS